MIQSATLSWLLVAAVSGASWTGIPVPDGRCDPWPACEEAAEPAWSRSVLRRVEPAERFPRAGADRAGPTTLLRDTAQELFEYSDGYSTRLDIHRVASYATLPLFVAQVVIGEVLLRNVGDPPEWAKTVHGPLAGALAGLFVVNTVTGGLNLLEARRDPNVESRTLIHSMLMLLADAGFVWTGMTVSKAGTVAPNGRVRTTHRKVALIAMGVATTGYVIMIPPFRRY